MMYLQSMSGYCYFASKLANWKFLIAIMLVNFAYDSAISQTRQHYLQPEFRSFGGDLQLLDGNIVRMIGIGDNQSTLTAGMYATTFSMSGEIQENTQIDGIWGEYALGYATLPLADGSVVILGDLMGCDHSIPLQLVCYGPGGNRKWYTLIDDIDFGYGP